LDKPKAELLKIWLYSDSCVCDFESIFYSYVIPLNLYSDWKIKKDDDCKAMDACSVHNVSLRRNSGQSKMWPHTLIRAFYTLHWTVIWIC